MTTAANLSRDLSPNGEARFPLIPFRYGSSLRTVLLVAVPASPRIGFVKQEVRRSSHELGQPHFQQLTRSVRFWKAPDREWFRARSKSVRPSGVRVKTSCSGPTS